MKIITRCVINLKGEVIEEESFLYNGPIAHCGGGGGGGGGGGSDEGDLDNDYTVSGGGSFYDSPQVTYESPFTGGPVSAPVASAPETARGEASGTPGYSAPTAPVSNLMPEPTQTMIEAKETLDKQDEESAKDIAKKAGSIGSMINPLFGGLAAAGAWLYGQGSKQMREEGITGLDLQASEAEAEAMGAGPEREDEGVTRMVAKSARKAAGAPIVRKKTPEAKSTIEDEEEKAKRRTGRASTRTSGRLGVQNPANIARRKISRLGRSR